jgi:hypothetical protein
MHVTDEAAADQFIAAANAFRMQKMGTDRLQMKDSGYLDLAIMLT